MIVNWALGFGMVLTSAFAVAVGLWVDAVFFTRRPQRPVSVFADQGHGTVFLFDGERLLDCTPSGRSILAAQPQQSGSWARLMSWLAPHFQDLDARLKELPQIGHMTLVSDAGARKSLLLMAEIRGGVTRLTLVDVDEDDDLPQQDPMTHRATVEELDQLREVVLRAPFLIWKEKDDGAVIWANAAYLTKVTERLDPESDITWPLPRLFDLTASAQGPSNQRQTLHLNDGREVWYELHSHGEGTNRVVFALPADQLVVAERSLRDVLVTLTKTFAHLHVALAIFDKNRQLQLFNPAMIDLTNLPVDFLARKPTLRAVMDAMRERNMIPEPKDYRTWRKTLTLMEKEAASGSYEETWSLPSGQTYRVIGRPHPDGALALILEDISDEMTRSRRYRAEIELGLSVIDGLDDGVAVFSQSGQLVVSNGAYQRLWGHDPAGNLGEATLGSVLARWKSGTAPTPIWARFEDFVGANDRKPWVADARLADGRQVQCRFNPLVAGSTMVAFRVMLPLPVPAALPDDSLMRA